MKYLYLTLSSVTIAYLVLLIFIYFYQRNLLYLPSENNYQNDKIQFSYEEIFIKVDDKITLKSWLINKDFKEFKTLVLFHGNAGDLSNRIYMQVNCINLDYRFLKDFYYQEPMGNGEPSTIFDEVGKWEVTNEGSIGNSIRKFVCNYK